eukprot:554570-Hanusia_phi.AAC.2
MEIRRNVMVSSTIPSSTPSSTHSGYAACHSSASKNDPCLLHPRARVKRAADALVERSEESGGERVLGQAHDAARERDGTESRRALVTCRCQRDNEASGLEEARKEGLAARVQQRPQVVAPVRRKHLEQALPRIRRRDVLSSRRVAQEEVTIIADLLARDSTGW